MKIIEGGICAAKGFTAGGIHCGIRKNKDKKAAHGRTAFSNINISEITRCVAYSDDKSAGIELYHILIQSVSSVKKILLLLHQTKCRLKRILFLLH